MKIKGWIIFATMFIAAIIQITAMEDIALLGAKPDILFILVVFFSLYYDDDKAGLMAAVSGGLLKDITSTALFGSNTFGFCLCALFLRYYGNFYKPKVFTQAALCGILYYITAVVILFVNRQAFDSAYINLSSCFWMMFKVSFYTAVVSPALFFVLSKLFRVRIAYV
ncbi:MAG: rod shape-determining protein MreD [Candidatus Omnitrophica bacterium]|nr:rod shape-determining protein MreD [Candidatus Omnitrophota bacterium]